MRGGTGVERSALEEAGRDDASVAYHVEGAVRRDAVGEAGAEADVHTSVAEG